MSVLKDLWLIEKTNDDFALVICNGQKFSVPLSALPDNIKEGDILEPRLQNGELLKRKEELINLFNSLKEH